jgi:FKBP-type peptidyl-prolyl cis-trans isomerase
MKLKTILLSIFITWVGLLSAQKTPAKKPAAKKAVAKSADTVRTKSGLKYIITKKNPAGRKPVKGDQVSAHYTGTLTNGKKFDSSRDGKQPYAFILGNHEVIEGWDEGFLYLREGESAVFVVPASLGYGSQDMGDIPPNSVLVFEVELVKVRKAVAYEPYSGEGKDTVKLKTGLQYIVIDKGNVKEKAKAGDTALIFYAGYLLDGNKFDGNFGRFDPYVLPVVGANVIHGWQQMIPLMNKGMKVRVIIPAYMGYGDRGYPGIIPPDAILVFDMYLMDLQ